jgi:hypothetical protein
VKRILRVAILLALAAIACSLGGPSSGEAPVPTDTRAVLLSPTPPPATLEPTAEVATLTPAPLPTPTVTPTVTPTAAPAEPLPPREFSFTILGLLFEQEVIINDFGFIGVQVRVLGLALNESDITLQTPRIYIVVYSGETLIDYQGVAQSHGMNVLPGERAAFTTVDTSFAHLEHLVALGYDLNALRYEVGLFADAGDRLPLVPYREMEVVSFTASPRDFGTFYEVTVENTGDREAYCYLNWVAYDADGQVIDAGFVSVATDVAPRYRLLPGTVATQIVFLPPETAEFEFFLLGTLAADPDE